MSVAPDLTPSLVVALRGGAPEAARLLEQLYRDAMIRLAWGYLGDLDDAEDAAQEVFVNVLAADRVPDDFRAWLYRVARNHCLNARRGRGRRRDRARMVTDAQISLGGPGVLTQLVVGEDQVRVAERIARLSDEQQEVLRLRYAEGLSRQEIAHVVDAPESTVKSRLYEALRTLRDDLG